MVAADAHLFDASFFCLFQCQAKHLGGVAVLPLRGADAVPDVPAVGQQVIVEPVAAGWSCPPDAHAHPEQDTPWRAPRPGGGGGRVFQLAELGQPGIEVGIFVQSRGAVHPGADGQKFFPVGHYLFPGRPHPAPAGGSSGVRCAGSPCGNPEPSSGRGSCSRSKAHPRPAGRSGQRHPPRGRA